MSRFSIAPRFKASYDTYYDGPSEWRRLGAISKVNNVRSLCEHLPHCTILEIGAGDGAVIQGLSEIHFGSELYAVEISDSGIQTIRQRQIHSLLECNLYDGYSIPYDDDRFDLAIMSHVLEHVEYPRRLLYEASRVAHVVFIEVPLLDNMRLSNDYQCDAVGHINSYSPKTLRREVQTCDLEVLSQVVRNPSWREYKYSGGWKTLPRYFAKAAAVRMLPHLAPYFWTYHSALTCRRRGKEAVVAERS